MAWCCAISAVNQSQLPGHSLLPWCLLPTWQDQSWSYSCQRRRCPRAKPSSCPRTLTHPGLAFWWRVRERLHSAKEAARPQMPGGWASVCARLGKWMVPPYGTICGASDGLCHLQFEARAMSSTVPRTHGGKHKESMIAQKWQTIFNLETRPFQEWCYVSEDNKSIFVIKCHISYTDRKSLHTSINKDWLRYFQEYICLKKWQSISLQGALTSLPTSPALTHLGVCPAHISRFVTSLCWWKLFSGSTLPVEGGLDSVALLSCFFASLISTCALNAKLPLHSRMRPIPASSTCPALSKPCAFTPVSSPNSGLFFCLSQVLVFSASLFWGQFLSGLL